MMLTKTTAKRPRMRHAVVPGLLLLLIVALHALPGEDIAHASWLDALHVDKFVHMGLFLTFAHSVFVGLGKSGMLRVGRVWATVGCVLLGIALEGMQGAWCPGRFPDAWDAMADAVGVGLAWLSFRVVYRFWPGFA